ncbi:hypothetical protein [Sphingomonas aurantiaca]|uniref:hypothetical protein n=1 Tax=Sphingomonas aurantiaca TaxID=185949 RepID=UPI00335491BC
MMGYSEPLASNIVSISISDSPDLASLGMVSSHLKDATAEISRHLLALGARVAYGGDLRPGGFTRVLFELVARHRRDADEGDDSTGLVSYLAWPVHIERTVADLERQAEEVRGMASLLLLDLHGQVMNRSARRSASEHKPSAEEWGSGLTAMRQRMVADTDARIVAGGRTEGFMGDLPGVAEEALLTLRGAQPLYVLGGFGGCAADIAAAMCLMGGRPVPDRNWNGLENFRSYGADDLSNGLTRAENETLAQTQHIDEANTLILRGLMRRLN